MNRAALAIIAFAALAALATPALHAQALTTSPGDAVIVMASGTAVPSASGVTLAKITNCRASQGTIAITGYSGISAGGTITISGGTLALAVHSPGAITCITGIATGTQISPAISAPAGDVAIFGVVSKSAALTIPAALTALQNAPTLAGGYSAGAGAMSETFKAAGADFLASLAIALPGTLTASPPPRQVPIQFTLTLSDGTPATGTITLYSVAVNSSGFATATPVPGGSCTLSGGKATCFVLAAASGWYQFQIAGPVAASETFLPGAFPELLAKANALTATCTLDKATAMPMLPCSLGAQ